MEAETAALPLPDDALAAILSRLPPRTLAASRCVCKAWHAVVDAHGLLLPHLLPHAVRGLFINYREHSHPLFFGRSSSAISGEDDPYCGSFIDHCNGLLIYGRRDEHYVINPATRRRDRLPPRMEYPRDYAAYLVFDPAVSPQHYEVFLVPVVPEKPKAVDPRDIPPTQFSVSKLFTSCDDALEVEDADEGEEDVCIDESREPPPPPSMEEGFFPPKRLPLSLRWRLGEPHDTYGSMEWPPSPCTLHVFSSSTGRWEERRFVREGEAIGTVEDARLEPSLPVCWGPRWRYGVYLEGALYVHCRGGFVMRLSLTDSKYHIVKTPVDIKDRYAQPCLGRSVGGVYFATIRSYQLRVWILLHESCGQREWMLKHNIDLERSVLCAAVRLSNNNPTVGPWILMDGSQGKHSDDELLPKEHIEWDSDGDDSILEEADDDGYISIKLLGFHPYKEVVFLMVSFTVVAYHLNTSKVQWLGQAYPRYYYAYSEGVYETFPYTPCMIGGP